MRNPEDMTLDEIYAELRKLKKMVKKPFVQVVSKTQIRKHKGRVYRYTYYYAQVRKNGKWHTRYLGKEVPPEIQKRLELQRRYKELKKELRKRLEDIG